MSLIPFMKKIILIFFLLSPVLSFAQVCRAVKIDSDSTKRALLSEYIKDCYKKSYLSKGKGIVSLTVYKDDEGLTRWYLTAMTDDRYRVLPPEQYALFNNEVFLIYEGAKTGLPSPIVVDAQARNKCIGEVVDNRLTKYLNEPRYTSVIDEKGESKKVRIRHDITGDKDNGLIIIFKKDGSFSKYAPA
jgi:hypothetical protein